MLGFLILHSVGPRKGGVLGVGVRSLTDLVSRAQVGISGILGSLRRRKLMRLDEGRVSVPTLRGLARGGGWSNGAPWG